MIPHKPFDVLLDDMIDADIQDWLEERDRGTTVEPEQMELEIEE